jgi:hypothetical protein
MSVNEDRSNMDSSEPIFSLNNIDKYDIEINITYFFDKMYRLTKKKLLEEGKLTEISVMIKYLSRTKEIPVNLPVIKLNVIKFYLEKDIDTQDNIGDIIKQLQIIKETIEKTKNELDDRIQTYITEIPSIMSENFSDILFIYNQIFNNDLTKILDNFILDFASKVKIGDISKKGVIETGVIETGDISETGVIETGVIETGDISETGMEKNNQIIEKFIKEYNAYTRFIHPNSIPPDLHNFKEDFLRLIIYYINSKPFNFLNDEFFDYKAIQENVNLEIKKEFVVKNKIKYLYDININYINPNSYGITSIAIIPNSFSLATIIPSEIKHDFGGKRSSMTSPEFKNIKELIKIILEDEYHQLLKHVMNETGMADFLITNLLPWSFKRGYDDDSLLLINPIEYNEYKGYSTIPNFVKMGKEVLLCSDSITKPVDPVSFALTSNNNSLVKYDAGNVTTSYSARDFDIKNTHIPLIKFYKKNVDYPIIIIRNKINESSKKLEFIVKILNIDNTTYFEVNNSIDSVSVSNVYQLYQNYLIQIVLPFLQKNKSVNLSVPSIENILSSLLYLKSTTANADIKNMIKEYCIRIIYILFLKASGDLIYIVSLAIEMSFKIQITDYIRNKKEIKQKDYDIGVVSSVDYSLIQSSLINLYFVNSNSKNDMIKTRNYVCSQIIAFTHVHHNDLIFPVTLMQKFITTIIIILNINEHQYEKLMGSHIIHKNISRLFKTIRNYFRSLEQFLYLRFFDYTKISKEIMERFRIIVKILPKHLLDVNFLIEQNYLQEKKDIIKKITELIDIINAEKTNFNLEYIIIIFDNLIVELKSLVFFLKNYFKFISEINITFNYTLVKEICDKVLEFTKLVTISEDMKEEKSDNFDDNFDDDKIHKVEISNIKISNNAYLFAEIVARMLFITYEEANQRLDIAEKLLEKEKHPEQVEDIKNKLSLLYYVQKELIRVTADPSFYTVEFKNRAESLVLKAMNQTNLVAAYAEQIENLQLAIKANDVASEFMQKIISVVNNKNIVNIDILKEYINTQIYVANTALKIAMKELKATEVLQSYKEELPEATNNSLSPEISKARKILQDVASARLEDNYMEQVANDEKEQVANDENEQALMEQVANDEKEQVANDENEQALMEQVANDENEQALMESKKNTQEAEQEAKKIEKRVKTIFQIIEQKELQSEEKENLKKTLEEVHGTVVKVYGIAQQLLTIYRLQNSKRRGGKKTIKRKNNKKHKKTIKRNSNNNKKSIKKKYYKHNITR